MCTVSEPQAELDIQGAPVASTAAALGMLKAHLAEVCSAAASVVVADYEGGEPARVDDLVQRSETLVSSALEALDVVSVLCGGVDDDVAPDSDGDRTSFPNLDAETVGDVVVLARMDLRGRKRALMSLGERSSPVDRLAAAGSALRAIQKSLSAIDGAVSTGAQVPRSINFYGQTLARSLDVRKRYVRFHKVIAGDGAPAQQASAVAARLRTIGNSIAQLLGKHVALHLRTGDRALLMMSHARIREWLVEREPGAQHVAAGLRLWQDLVNIATMFLDVNKREELVLHDGRLVREALLRLPADVDGWEDATWGEPDRRSLLDHLQPARGRSPVLDALLDTPPSEIQLPALRALLADLDRTLNVASPDITPSTAA